eukprot:symbB.v1.2.014919.t1/scaffold1100.1/size328752/9
MLHQAQEEVQKLVKEQEDAQKEVDLLTDEIKVIKSRDYTNRLQVLRDTVEAILGELVFFQPWNQTWLASRASARVMLLKVKQTAISCLATSIEGRALVATLVNGIGARRILSQGSGKFRLNFHSLPIGRVSLHNELALESNVTDVESKEFAKHLEDRMRYWLVRKKDWRKAISILRACKLNAFNSDARGSPDQFVLQLLPYLPLLVGSCAKVSKWLQALQMTKEFLAKMCGIPDSSLLLAQADIAKTLASQHLVQPALSLLVPDDVSATVDPTDEAALLARRAFTSASRILLVASFQSANWMVSLQALQCLHALRCRPQSLDRAAAQCLASCSEWPVAIALAVEPQFQRCLGLQSYTSFARICGFQAWPIALHLAEDGETRKELQVAQSSMLQDVLLAARMKEQQWQDSFAFFRALEDQKAHRDKEMTRLETRGSSHAPRDVHAVTGATLVTSRGAEMEVSNSVWTKAGGTGRHPSRLSFDALIRSCCDGFQENDTGWQESFELLERLKVNFGSFRTYDAYTLCEVMRACVSGAQWQHSILFLDVLGPAHPDSRTLSYILTIRASSMPRHWLMVLALLARSKNQRVRPHVGMYDAAIFSCKGTWDHPWSQWTRALRILEEVRWKRLRCNPFMRTRTNTRPR